MNELQGKRAAILVEQQYQEMEVWYPLLRFREAGADVVVDVSHVLARNLGVVIF